MQLKSTVLLLTFVIAASAMTPTVQAQAESASPHLQTLETLRERLDLSDSQATEIEPILFQQSVSRQAVFEKHDINPNMGRSAPRPSRSELFALVSDLRPLHERTNAAMADILTAEQIEEWQRFQLERFNRLQRRLRGRR